MHRVSLDFSVKTYDIDFAGIVSNLVYIRWLEDLRLELLAQRYPLERMVADGIGPVLLETSISYREVITIHDSPTGDMEIESIGNLRWTVAARFTSSERRRVHATARQTGIFIRLDTRRPVRVPPALRSDR